MAKRKRTDPADELSGKLQGGKDRIDPATNAPTKEDPQEERHLNKSSGGNENDAVESRHLARSRSRNNSGSSRMWGYKNGDGTSPDAPSNEAPSNLGSDDRKLNTEQSFEEGSTTTGKRLEQDNEPEDPQT